MLKNIFKTIVIFIFSVTVFGFIFVFLYKNEGAVFYGVNLSFDKVSSIPDIFNSIIGIPITVAGTLLALTLAKVAYEITEKEFNRDNLLIFTEKYENYYKSFSGISISINKIVYLSSYFFHEYEILMMNMAQADRYGDDTKDYYGEFYKHLKSELNICGFFEELKKLEEYFTLLQSQPVLSSFFEKKVVIAYMR